MAKLPYPPAPELGWYSDDPVEGTPDSAVGTAEPQNDYGQPSSAETAANTAFAAEPAVTAATAAAEPAATAPADTTPHAAENDIRGLGRHRALLLVHVQGTEEDVPAA